MIRQDLFQKAGNLFFGTDVPTPIAAPAPSLDGYISEADRRTVARLPEEGKQQFRENVHEYIGQLGKDYKVGEERKE
jgi:hypothetical protein